MDNRILFKFCRRKFYNYGATLYGVEFNVLSYVMYKPRKHLGDKEHSYTTQNYVV